MFKIGFAQKVRIKITCSDLEMVINAASNKGVVLSELEFVDILSLICSTDALCLRELKRIIEQYGGELVVIHHSGLYYIISGIRSRWVIAAAAALVLLLTVWIPTRVLFVRVDGNIKVSSDLILEKAEDCGIIFGASRRLVRSEAIKNKLLSELPQLQWVGVNTCGCVALISVVERDELQTRQKIPQVSSIIAACDGVIRDLTVYSGTPLCEIGQAVHKGQVLVSGYTDCGIVVRAEEARAEITAQTKHSVTAISPVDYSVRGKVTDVRSRYSIQIGKKTIKLFKDSGISDPICVRIYKTNPVTLPGGFVLPLAVIAEEITYTDTCNIFDFQNENWDWLQGISDSYVSTQMLSGRILGSFYTQMIQDGLCTQYAVYDCIEVIGKVRTEEGLLPDGKRD